MSRKKVIHKTRVNQDPKFNSATVMRFASKLMEGGKQSLSFKILYSALDKLEEKTNETALDAFEKVLHNVKPLVEVRSRRVGGSTYQIPVEIRPSRSETLGMKWIIKAARKRHGRSMVERLSSEFLEAYNKTGSAVKTKDDLHRMAEANKAFSHYKW